MGARLESLREKRETETICGARRMCSDHLLKNVQKKISMCDFKAFALCDS